MKSIVVASLLCIGMWGCPPEGDGRTGRDAHPEDMQIFDSGPPAGPAWASLELTGPNQVAVGQSIELFSQPLTADGMTTQNPVVLFESTDTRILSVDSEGVVTAHAVGIATVRATFEQLSAELRIDVSDATPVDIRIEPGDYTGTMQAPTAFEVIALNAEGIAIQPSQLECTVQAPELAEVVSSAGAECVLRGLAAGETQLIARADGLEATATLVITDPPATSIHAFNGFPDVLLGENRYMGPSFSAGNGRMVSGSAQYTIEPWQFAGVENGVVLGRQVGYAKMSVEALGETYEQAVYIVPSYMANEQPFPGPCAVTSSHRVRHLTYEGDLLVEDLEERGEFGPRERNVYQYEDDLLVRKETWRLDLPELDQPKKIERYYYDDRLLVRTESDQIRPVESVITHHDRDEEGRLVRERRCPDGSDCEVTGYWTYDDLGRIATSGHEGITPENTVYEYLDGEVREVTTYRDGEMVEVRRLLDGAGHQRFKLVFEIRPDLGGRLTISMSETFYDRGGNLRRTAHLPRPLLGASTVGTTYDYDCWEMD